ncbi:glycosyltransferase family 39 protein [Actinoplanes sp. TBRC 11911]|uniref:glycosyltransferase family 39 protein n=1 Tax=Actinoplanes sp. TBRC 11911 TaxID=2729386 RepID=UPI0028A26DA1|nr:glycosyltransferase family 39 protein [Actinoplanes sp. TBRC 11911]
MIPRRSFAWKPVTAVAVLVVLLLLPLSSRYDYHRDELYFRILGRHLQWGYVDQPPLVPLLSRMSIAVFGDSLWAIRVPGALLLAAMAFLTALIAREVGGAAVGQTLAASAVFGTFPLVGGHVGNTQLPDLLAWLGVLYFLLRVLLRGSERSWLGVGVVTGLALYAKLLIPLLLICLLLALLVVGPRRVLLSRWLLAGAGLAVLIGLPNILYQVFNDFPQAHMADAIAADKGTDSRIQLLPFQLILIGLALVPVWVAGFVTLVRDPRLRAARSIAVAYPIMVVLVFVTAGQPYYPIGLVLGLFAIGAVPVERWMAGRAGRRVLLGVAVGVNLVISVVFALPVLPVSQVGFIAAVNSTVADQIGWNVYVRQVAAVYTALPADEQQRAVLFTSNYGEAGALDRYGAAYRLPAVYSGHNELWNYGPPPDSRTVAIVVSQAPAAEVNATLGRCDLKAQLDNGLGIENEEPDGAIYVCRNLPAPWHTLWPGLQHYD